MITLQHQPTATARQRPGVLQPSGAFRGVLAIVSLLAFALGSSSCSSDTVRCRKVSAQEFMRQHKFKGVPTDAFIGITEDRAFKKIYRLGFEDSWEVIWIPVEELPSDYLRTAKQKEPGFSGPRASREEIGI